MSESFSGDWCLWCFSNARSFLSPGLHPRSDKFLLATHRWWVLIRWRQTDRDVHERLRVSDSRYGNRDILISMNASMADVCFNVFRWNLTRRLCIGIRGLLYLWVNQDEKGILGNVCHFPVRLYPSNNIFQHISPAVESTCDQEVYNNITYFVSPKFPALMPGDKENCSIKIKLVSDDISQIRLDFVHFTLVNWDALIW